MGAEHYVDLGFDFDDIDDGNGILVLPHSVLPVQDLIVRLTLPGKSKAGIFGKNFEDPDRYRPLADVPSGPYWIEDFDPGLEYRGLPPRDAIPRILASGRRPASIEEGLAAFVHNRHVLQRNACFSLAGSTRGDKRVPALWISSGAPKLGWCFAGAPHTWLGCASVPA